jgi:hypothetical protein
MTTGPIAVDFTITQDAGTDYPYGFAAVAFDVINGGTTKIPADFSCVSGISISYSTTKKVFLKLISNANSANPAQYQVALPTTGATFIPFTDFAQPTWATAAQTFALNLQDIEAIQFQAHSENGVGDMTFTLNSIGLGTGGGVIPVLDRVTASDFSLNLGNQGLRFSGLKEMGKMQVELYNLQGQLMAAQEVSAARDFLSTASMQMACTS